MRWSQVRGTAAAKPRASGRGEADWRTGVPLSRAVSMVAAEPAAAVLEALSLGCSKVAGMLRKVQRLDGQMMTKARPMTELTGMAPPPGSPMWPRES